MIHTIGSEWLKARTLKGTWILAAVALAFPVLVGVLYTALVGTGDMEAEELYDAVTTAALVTTMLLGVMAATNITAEYGTNTIRPTLAATPRRMRVVVAKAVVVALVAMAVQAAASAVAFAAGSAIASARDVDLDLAGLDRFWVAAGGQVLFVGLVACLGLGFGFVVRATPAAVALVILWPLLIESLLGGLLGLVVDGAADWMPYGAGTSLHALDPANDSLGRLGGGLYFAAFTAIVLLLGGLLTNRRDA